LAVNEAESAPGYGSNLVLVSQQPGVCC